MHLNKILIFVAIVSVVLLSCSGNRIFDEVVSLPEDEWKAEEVKNFTVPVNDTINAFDVWVHIRNSHTYAYSNLWLFVKTTAPSGVSMTDTIELFLADPSGKWLGSGLGSVNSMLLPYRTNIKFPQRGIYTFEFKQGMRQEELKGIMDVGLRIDKRK